MSNIGLILKNLLEEKNISQRDLAKQIGVTEVSISRYINGDREPKMYILEKISKVLNVSIDFILGSSNSSFSSSDSEYNKYIISAMNAKSKGISHDLINKIVDLLAEENKKYNVLNDWGLIGIYEKRAEMNIQCEIHFNELQNNLDISAFGLKSFRDNKGDDVFKKVANGLKIRILTIEPNSIFLKQREKDELEVEGQIKKTIFDLIKWIKSLQQHALTHGHDQANIQIKFYDTLPLDFYFREDDYVYIGPYIYGISSQRTISYEFISGSKGFDYYKNYFDRLWNDKKFSKPLEELNIY